MIESVTKKQLSPKWLFSSIDFIAKVARLILETSCYTSFWNKLGILSLLFFDSTLL